MSKDLHVERCATENAHYELIDRSGVFDRGWYLTQYPEVALMGIDPVLDYVDGGARLGRNPNALFDGQWYLLENPAVERAGGNPLVHYLLHGAAERCEPSPLFDTQWWLAKNRDLAERFIRFEGGKASVSEAQSEGVGSYTQPTAVSINPLVHYLQHGWQRGVLPFNPGRLLAGIKAAVIVHLFYAELWDEILSWLRNIPIAFDLFVSIPRDHGSDLRALVLRDYPQARLVEVRNAGRDVGAFFAVLPMVLAANYSVLCKLHSKKGKEYPEAWRDLLLRGVLANKMLVARILHAFASDPELVLAGAREVYLCGRTHMTKNKDKLEEITRQLYPGESIPEEWGFFAGTMFWARPDFFQPFMQCGANLLDFETDNTCKDGQLAHAFERMFGALAVLQRKRIALTEITGLGLIEGTIHLIEAPGEPCAANFLRILREHALRLGGDLPFTRIVEPLGRAWPTAAASQRTPNEHRQILIFMRKWLARAKTSCSKLPTPALRALRIVYWAATFKIVSGIRAALLRRRDAKLVASSELFDRDWYLEHYPEVRAAGVDPALHYAAHGAAGSVDPGPRFDSVWYLAYYPDVAAARANPLAHYLLYGAKEGRHPHPSRVLIGEVTDAALSCRKAPVGGGEIALFVAHSPDGSVKPHVRHYLAALQQNGIHPVLIVTTDLEFYAEPALLALVEGLYVRTNVGYDFGAWAHVVRQNPQLLSADILYLVNDSIIGPLNQQKFEHLLHRIRSSKSDVIGLTDSYEKGWHIQSYFIALKRQALTSIALRKFIDSIKNLSDKRGVITAYEARFAPVLQAAGLSCEVLFPVRNAGNQSLTNWHGLVRSGLPFVKVTALRHFSRSFETRNWRRILRSEGFDPQLAEQALTSAPSHGTPAEL